MAPAMGSRLTMVLGAAGSVSLAGFGTRRVRTGRASMFTPSRVADRSVIMRHHDGSLWFEFSPRNRRAAWTISCMRVSVTWCGPPLRRPGLLYPTLVGLLTLPLNISGVSVIRGDLSHAA